MLKTLDNLEIRAMVELKEFIEIAMNGLEEIEILKLSVDDIINILDYNFISDEDFAYHYAITKSESKGISYIEKNPITNRVEIKREFKLTMNDATKVSIFLKLLNDSYSIDDAKSIVNGVDTALYKHFHYEKAKEQLFLYNLALKYGRKANLRINAILEFYSMFCR